MQWNGGLADHRVDRALQAAAVERVYLVGVGAADEASTYSSDLSGNGEGRRDRIIYPDWRPIVTCDLGAEKTDTELAHHGAILAFFHDNGLAPAG